MASRVERLRKVCLALPDAEERETWGHPTFRVRNKIFVGCSDDASSMSFKADPEEREALLGDDRFDVADYVGRFGWVSMSLSGRIDWTEIDELVRTSYCLIAPKTLARQVLPDER